MPQRQQQAEPDPDPGPSYIDEEHQRIAEFAEDFMDEDERDSFVDHLMERRGYQRIQSWGPRAEPPPDPDPEPPAPRGGRGGGGSGRRGGYFKR